MERSIFAQVKRAFAKSPKASLESLGISLHKNAKGEWLSGNCAICSDTSKSCSYSHEGFLNCHQCGRKDDLFVWFCEREGLADNWAACKELAGKFGIRVEFKKTRGSRPPRQMTSDNLDSSVVQLADADPAGPLRDFLKERKLYDPVILAQLGVGFAHGVITFAQFDQKGGLRPRYRRYSPGAQVKHTWSPGKGETQGFWPYVPVPEGGVILILEGEWDVLTAIIRLKLWDQGIYPFTWTGGANSPVPPQAIPKAWHGHEVHLCYDNDVFQGPTWKNYYAPDTIKMVAMERRRRNLLESVAPAFGGFGCEVVMRTIPIDPNENWGADFRDWVDGGGETLDDIPSHALDQCEVRTFEVIDCDFKDVHDHPGCVVRFKCQVEMINLDGLIVPTVSTIDCLMNQRTQCQDCLVPSRYPEQTIEWQHLIPQQVRALLARDSDKYIKQTVLGKPNGCPHAIVETAEHNMTVRWTAVDGDSSSAQELTVISKEAPDLAGDVEVVGKVYNTGKAIVVMAEHLSSLDGTGFNIADYAPALFELCPSDAQTVQEIDEFLNRKTDDLAAHVTKIHGRRDIHVAHELLAHSTSCINVEGQPVRGWLDISVIGHTRTGKSLTFQRLINYHECGMLHACMENTSRAGLTIGAVQSKDGIRMRPGLFPRLHRKMLVLDEFHYMVRGNRENPTSWLQTARDSGKAYGSKVYGSRAVPAEVRLCTIGNWAYGSAHHFRFKCEHFRYLYDTPESIARLDFGMVVGTDPDEDLLPDAPHQWTQELYQALVMRAWGQTHENVVIDNEAGELAAEQCESWRGVYDSDRLPLFSPEEKVVSLLRIATAVANICFSSYQGELAKVHVRKVHVEWAIEWLTRMWVESGYDAYSKALLLSANVVNAFSAEALITIKLALNDAEHAVRVIVNMIGGMKLGDVCGMLGCENHIAAKWLSQMLRLNVLQRDRADRYHLEYSLTQGGALMVHNLMLFAEDYPDQWAKRYEAVTRWAEKGNPANDPGFLPMDLPTNTLVREWEDVAASDPPHPVIEGPGFR